MGAISTRTINVPRLWVAKGLFLRTFAVWRPLLSLAPMGRSYGRKSWGHRRRCCCHLWERARSIGLSSYRLAPTVFLRPRER
jgi:hypothetical protein